MQYVLQKESQEAERKKIEAGGIAEFQRIVSADITPAMLTWKVRIALPPLPCCPATLRHRRSRGRCAAAPPRPRAPHVRTHAPGSDGRRARMPSARACGYRRWRPAPTSQAIEVTHEIAMSNNAKIVMIGNQKDSLPVILGGEIGAAVETSALPSVRVGPEGDAGPSV